VKMVSNMVKGARSAGSFLGGIFNNPGVVVLGALAIGLLFFAPNIRKAFGDLGESISSGLVNFEFPDIQLPTFNFPEITFPTFDFPEINFPDISNIFEGPSEFFEGAGEQATDFFANLQNQFNAFIGGVETMGPEEPPLIVEDTGLIENPAETCPCGSTIIQDIQGNVNQQCIACQQAETQEIDIFAPVTNGAPSPEPSPPIDFGVTIAPGLVGETEGFLGGGPSFIGGTIFETPDTLSSIIDRLKVTASQAANILAIQEGFTPEEQSFLGQGQELSPLGDIGPQVSDSTFQGLTPEQIFARLVGGNISNF